jgi:uncharacterized protein YjbJ (UPF0337 family)
MSNSNEDERAKGKAEEIKGKVKSGIGNLVDDGQLEAEGQADQAVGQARQDVAKGSERAKGAGEEIAGKVKGVVGRVTGSEEKEAEGKADELKGKARQKANK